MASPLHKDLRPMRPAHRRDAALQIFVFLTAFSLYRIAYVYLLGWWWLPLLILTFLTFVMMVAGWTSIPASRRPRAKLGAFREYFQAGTDHLNVMVGGFAGGEIFTAAFRHQPIESRSYARVFWDAGESVLLYFYDLAETLDPLKKSDHLTNYVNVYDESVTFPEMHGRLEYSGHTRITLHAQSMGADYCRRFIAWLEQTHPVRSYQIAGLHIMEGTIKLRPLTRFALAVLHIYWGNAALQWIWTHGLYALVFPTPKVERKLCRADGRESVTELIRFRHKFQSVCGTLARMNALYRSRAWVPLTVSPATYPVFYTALSTDTTTDPKASYRILRAVYGHIGCYVVPGTRRTIGNHGMVAEHPEVWQEAARMFLAYRNANPI